MACVLAVKFAATVVWRLLCAVFAFLAKPLHNQSGGLVAANALTVAMLWSGRLVWRLWLSWVRLTREGSGVLYVSCCGYVPRHVWLLVLLGFWFAVSSGRSEFVKFLCVAAILSAKFIWEKYPHVYQGMTRCHSRVIRLPCGIRYPVSASWYVFRWNFCLLC
jgi:hypothetical protein